MKYVHVITLCIIKFLRVGLGLWCVTALSTYFSYRDGNTSSVTSKLEELKWPRLEERRQKARLVLMYKIVNGLVKIDATDRLVQPSRLSRNMGQHSFQIPSCNTIIRKESFYPRTIRDWNALPTDTATAKSLESFKAHLLD